MMLPEALGTLPGWITAIASTGGVGMLLQWQVANRKARRDEIGDDRAGFGVLISTLQADVREMHAQMALVRAELGKAHADHRDCERRLSAAENEVAAIRRQFAAAQFSYARLPSTPTSPAIDDAMDQLDKLP